MNLAKHFFLALLVCGGAQLALGADAPAPASAPAATPPAATSAQTSAAKSDAKSDEVFLFAFFRNERDGLRLATSKDGLKWDALNADKTFLPPQVGGRLMRDPALLFGPDGNFHLVWTTSWTGQSIGYSSSKDLITWTPQQEIKVMGDFADTRQSWAPEIRYDKAKGEYVIYWSSTVGPADAGRGPGAPYFKTYATTTKDFKTFTPTKVFFDAGFGQIDASILEDNGKYIMFFKHGGQGTQIATADSLQGPYTDTGTFFAYPNADQWEGAWPIKVGDEYYAYVDHYRSRDRMGLWRSRDLKTWEDITAQTTGLRGMSHGSVLKVPAALVENIIKATAASAAAAPTPTIPPGPAAPAPAAAPASATPPAAAAPTAAAAAPAPSKYKNTYVIVHGAWGGGWAFKEVDELLTDKGNKVYRPTLTGQGEKVHLTSPDIPLTTHVDDIANVILWENLHDVVLVGHSYGGMVITGVADKVPDRIKKIVYLDAVLPQDTESFGVAMSGGRAGRGLGRANESGYLPASRANLAKPIPHDVDMPAKPTTDPIALKNQEAVKKIPTTYILTVDRGRQPEQDQFYQAYLRAQARGWDMVVMEGDHNVQWSKPKELVDLLEKSSANLTPPNPPAQPAQPTATTTPATPAAPTPAAQ